MSDCKNLIHPFQNDPGVSQRQRVISDLLSGSAKIDGRNIAELLDYFLQLSKQLKYFDKELNVSDWYPFFSKSIPFTLASVVRYNKTSIQKRFLKFNALFDKKPNRHSLQLLIHYIYNQTIQRINSWHKDVKGSELSAEVTVEKLIKDKLNVPVRNFICLANHASGKYNVKKIDISKLFENEAWNLTADKIANACPIPKASTKRKRLIALRDEIARLFPGFLSVIDIAGKAAESSIEQSLFPLKQELQEKHPPHLAILFAFLKLFTHLQSDLNGFTKKHLDFFYQDVLKIKPRNAIADKTHILFAIQKQLDNYLLKKGIQVKDGKDNKKAEIYFESDDEIVVNKTEVADIRTLFLNKKIAYDKSYVEGVYMAPDSRKADGVKIDFKDDPKNWPTLGSKLSKYTDPEQKFIRPYPNARIGFIMASPVLLLNEGKRTITITLDCKLDDDYCKQLEQKAQASIPVNRCKEAISINTPDPCKELIEPYTACSLYDEVISTIAQNYYYISKDLIKEAIKQGVSSGMIPILKGFLHKTKPSCYYDADVFEFDRYIKATDFEAKFRKDQLDMLLPLFKPEGIFKIYFSGKKEWIEADEIIYEISGGVKKQVSNPEIKFDKNKLKCDDPNDRSFIITINAVLTAAKPAVTFYDPEALKEDINTTLPVVKVELNEHIKLEVKEGTIASLFFKGLKNKKKEICCLNKPFQKTKPVSLYHFFRNISLGAKTGIEVEVCELKNFVVQNDESIMDVNSPIHPFTAVPKIGSSFFIGCPEIFCKYWSSFNVKFNWKNKPTIPLNEYYHGYEDILATPVIDNAYFNEANYKFTYALLEGGVWKPVPLKNKPLFTNDLLDYCTAVVKSQMYQFKRTDFSIDAYVRTEKACFDKKVLQNDSRSGFFRMTLDNRDFQHSRYSFVLARQMMALGKFPKEIYIGPVYDGFPAAPPPPSSLDILSIDDLFTAIQRAYSITQNLNPRISDVIGQMRTAWGGPGSPNSFNVAFSLSPAFAPFGNPADDLAPPNPPYGPPTPPFPAFPDPSAAFNLYSVDKTMNLLDKKILEDVAVKIKNIKDKRVVIPNEPWTPIMQNISLDYKASADIKEIDLIHLHPYHGTYKFEELEETPTLFPTFCDEGTMYVGLKGLVTGSNLNVLFQLAEATADSELEREEVNWYYLDNNEWKSLRKGFEIIDDATNELTTSGIVKFAMPENMTNDNTILPKDLHWIKASIIRNSSSVSETIGIHPQAIQVVFTNDELNDKLRLDQPLLAGSVSKLKEADANVKTVEQPYDSFGGREPEVEKHYYVRVSEILRHKNRAIQKWDYERILLEAFPQIYKTKCINHSFALNAHQYHNDFPVAPGYVILAVIPDLTKLKAGNSFQPKAPVSLLEDIEEYMRKRTSPFVRLRAMNPRYEKVDFCLKVKLYKGKDENYYREQLKEDIREFLAPWAIGEYSKLSFGQCVTRSDLIRFIESLDYVDYILELKMQHEFDRPAPLLVSKDEDVCPKAPRSILIAGEIDVCIKQNDCDEKFDFYLQAGLKVLDNVKDPVEKLRHDLRAFINKYNGRRSSGSLTDPCADISILENFVKGLDYIDPAVALQVKLKHETDKLYGTAKVCPRTGGKLYLSRVEAHIQTNSKWHDLNIHSCNNEPEPVFDFCK